MAHQIIDLNSNVIDMDDLVHQATNQLFDAILSSKRAQDGVVAAYFS